MKRPEVLITDAKGWRTPYAMLAVMAGAMFLSFSGWSALLNNFSVERAGFTGREMGILQSIREIPGFLAFLAIFVVIVMREQTLALVSLTLLGLGVAVTGYYPSVGGLFLTTFVMSLGFHYYSTMETSLTLQWVPKERAPEMFGKIMSISDEIMWDYYSLLLLKSSSEIDVLKAGHPMENKKQLAAILCSMIHGEGTGEHEREQFEKVFSQNKRPDDMPSFSWSDLATEDSQTLLNLLGNSNLIQSKKEARRLIQQGSVKVNDERENDPFKVYNRPSEPMVIQAGKRVFFEVR